MWLSVLTAGEVVRTAHRAGNLRWHHLQHAWHISIPECISTSGAEMSKNKLEQLECCLMALTQYTAEGKAFLNKVVTIYDFWINHYNLGTKQASTNWKHAIFPTRKKFKARPNTRKVLLRFLGICLTDFTEHGILSTQIPIVHHLQNWSRRSNTNAQVSSQMVSSCFIIMLIHIWLYLLSFIGWWFSLRLGMQCCMYTCPIK